MGERRTKDIRRASVLALAAVGATAAYARFRRPREAGPPEPVYASGRGRPQGGVDIASRDAGYEVVDTNVRLLAIVMVISVAIIIAGVAIVFRMYAGFDRHFQATSAGMTSEQRAPIVPPLPHLQADPYTDIDAMLMEQNRRLTTYGWDGPAHRRAHIPIERAMRQVLGKPLDSAAQADAKGTPAGEASMPAPPAAAPTDKPANRVQGETRPGAIAPSYAPPKASESKP